MTSEEARLLRFAIRYPNTWHSFARGQAQRTRTALVRLEVAGAIDIDRNRPPAQWQFRLARPDRGVS